MYVCMCYQVNFSMWFVKVPTIILRALKSNKDTLLRRWELDSNLVATRGLPLLWMDKSSEDVSSLNHMYTLHVPLFEMAIHNCAWNVLPIFCFRKAEEKVSPIDRDQGAASPSATKKVRVKVEK